MHLAAINVFPVKSLRGESPASVRVHPWGLAGDRRFVLVGAAATCLTQRDLPRMALIQARWRDETLHLAMEGQASLAIAPPPPAAPGRTVVIWNDTVPGLDSGDAAAAWLSAALDHECRLLHMADPRIRPVNPAYAQAGETVSFADGFPVLLGSEASLADLNTRLDDPVTMLRFRPNLVVAGAAPWAEDRWVRIRIGGAIFRIAKPCDRCVMTTIDPHTALRPNPVQPIRALGTFRRDRRGGVMFGQNMVPEICGEMRVGDAVEVLETGAPNVDFVV